MKLLDLGTWPFSSRLLLELGQLEAMSAGHGQTTLAHLVGALLQMLPVRQVLVASAADVEAAVARALMLVPKSSGKMPILSPDLQRLSVAEAHPTVGVFLRAAATAPLLKQAGQPLLQHADSIAGVLDAPRLQAVLTNLAAPDVVQLLPHLVVGFARAATRKHACVTTRHVVFASLEMLDKSLQKKGLVGIGEAVAKMADLLDRTSKRRAEADKTVYYQARLVGAIAFALATPVEGAGARLLAGCLAGDDGIAFAVEARTEALARLKGQGTESPTQ